MESKVKTFSETAAFSKRAANPKFYSLIRKGSMSDADAKNRIMVYSKVMANNEAIRSMMKQFSGFAEMPLLTNQYFNATVTGNTRSFAGFLSIERDMNADTALLGYYDLLNVTGSRNVLPNTTYGDRTGLAKPNRTTATVTAATQVEVSTGFRIVPGSIEIKLNNQKMRDDAAGSLLAGVGVLTGAEINYATGVIKFTTATEAGTATIVFAEDASGDPAFEGSKVNKINRFKLNRKHIIAHAVPALLVGETDLMTLAGTEKGLGDNVVAIMGSKLAELYQRVVNDSLVETLVKGDTSTNYVIDMTTAGTGFYDYQSRLDYFESELIALDTKLANQSAVGVAANVYLVDPNVGNWFRRLKIKGGFKDNTDSTFIDDLLGTYNGIPVLRHKGVAANTGYAIHKTVDGQLAPIIRGIFLPLTQTPMVGNYVNPTQQAQGLYYQESYDSIAPELCQKFTIQ